MKKSTAILIAVACAILFAVALINRAPDISTEIGSRFFPELGEQLESTTEVSITDPSSNVVIQRSGDSWVVANRGNYPANVEDLRKLLRNLADTTITERKTANPALFSRVGLASIENADDDALTRRVVIKTAEKTLVDVIIGHRSDRGSFMRRSAENQAWLVNRDFFPDAKPREWLDKALIELPREQLQKVEIQPANGPAYEIGRNSADTFELQPVPAGRELAASGIDRVTGALRALTVADVHSDEQSTTADVSQWAKSRWYSRDGLVIDLSAGKHDSVTLARLTAETAADASDETKSAAKRINQKTAGRLIELPGHMANNLRLTLEQLLKPVEPSEQG